MGDQLGLPQVSSLPNSAQGFVSQLHALSKGVIERWPGWLSLECAFLRGKLENLTSTATQEKVAVWVKQNRSKGLASRISVFSIWIQGSPLDDSRNGRK